MPCRENFFRVRIMKQRLIAGTAAALLAAVSFLPLRVEALSAEKAILLDAVSGQVLADLAPLVDVIYARTSAEEAPALAEAVKAAAQDTAFVAMVTDAANMTTDYLLVES